MANVFSVIFGVSVSVSFSGCLFMGNVPERWKIRKQVNKQQNLATGVPDLVSVWDDGTHRILGRGEDSPKRVQFAEEEEDEAHEGSHDQKESQGDHIVHFPGFFRDFSRFFNRVSSGAWPLIALQKLFLYLSLFLLFRPDRPLRDFLPRVWEIILSF